MPHRSSPETLVRFALLLVLAYAAVPAAVRAQGTATTPGVGDSARSTAAVAQPAELPLWPGGAPGAIGDTPEDRPAVTPYLPPADRATGTAVVIFPGGGYDHLATDKEGVQPARWLNSLGIAAFVVRYRLGPRYHHPAMLADAARAVRLVRASANRWGVDPHRVGVLGFSAGGHMASTVGTHFDAGEPAAADPVDRESSRPDFMVLAYPVVTMDARWAHRGSRANLLGESPPPDLVRSLSNEMQVRPDTPPTFVVATTDDRSVPVENSLHLYEALKDAGVPAELHLFETGRHGFGLAAADPVLSSWPAQCERWMRRHGWLDPANHSPR